MRRTATRFYVYLADGQAVGPLNFQQIQEYDAEALVMKEGDEVCWPRRRWLANGERTVTQYDGCKTWVWLLAFAPALAWFFAPWLIREEWGVCWMIVITIAFVGMLLCKKDVPRFPGE